MPADIVFAENFHIALRQMNGAGKIGYQDGQVFRVRNIASADYSTDFIFSAPSQEFFQVNQIIMDVGDNCKLHKTTYGS